MDFVTILNKISQNPFNRNEDKWTEEWNTSSTIKSRTNSFGEHLNLHFELYNKTAESHPNKVKARKIKQNARSVMEIENLKRGHLPSGWEQQEAL
ncbi:hypothetical protein EVAR_58789_1 [Eumeta japonica]|uniref:Uncharacterized protein n=1 Tax=Eumeta variegata TaxID=151549 RepID=A0A4C1YHF1_EUMVA|nr:hypothetical protein EVAR_58789_1 [Eumeta japonica]